MIYEEDELEKYHEYLMFVRRKMIDDKNLRINELMDIEINNIDRVGDEYKFLCYVKLIQRKQKAAIIYQTINYERWKIMSDRDKKLSQLL